MPWMETRVMDEKLCFVAAALLKEETMSGLCAAFGISRKTGYKWLERYEAEGPAGLLERSRAPRRRPWEVPAAVSEAVLALRRRHPCWGPRKLRARLMEDHPDVSWPAASTLGDLLKRHGLVAARRRRRSFPPRSHPFQSCLGPNDVWTVDFKGWFRTGDGVRCDPLTLGDAFSRYNLATEHVARPDGPHVRRVFERTFHEYGLPLAIRSDNGPPFASRGLAGLSRLSVWWRKLGIRPERIDPGKPQQNGRHERFHLTLRQETAAPPAASVAAQQRRFEQFRQVYNQERPHEALGQKPPASVYRPSSRAYPGRLEEPEYSDGWTVRRVRSNGEIKFKGDFVFISEVLIGEVIGLVETSQGNWLVRFFDIDLGVIGRQGKLLPPPTSDLWICGQGQGLAHNPTAPAKTTKPEYR